MSSTPSSQLQVLRSSQRLKSLLFTAGYSVLFTGGGILAAFSYGPGRPAPITISVGAFIAAVGIAFGVVGIVRSVQLIRTGEFVTAARLAIVGVIAIPIVVLVVRILVL